MRLDTSSILRTPARALAGACTVVVAAGGLATFAARPAERASPAPAHLAAVDADPEGAPAGSGTGLPPTAAQDLFDAVTAIYRPEAQLFGADFAIQVTPGTSSAAFAANGETWKVLVPQGTLSSPGLTEDVLATIVCHEVGHLFGGFPMKWSPDEDLASKHTVIAVEEQADYFAGKDCLPRLWAADSARNAAAYAQLATAARADCDSAWSSEADRGICARTALAAETFGGWLALRHGTAVPALATPDSTQVDQTSMSYASDQCRVDTLFQGALCARRAPSGVIPGLTAYGNYTAETEAAAAPYACTEGMGARPRCWFKPNDPHFDCVAAQTLRPVCEARDGASGYRSCDPRSGLDFTACDFGCITGEDNYASCALSPDESESGWFE